MRRSRIQQIKPKPVVNHTNKPYVPLASVYVSIRPVAAAAVQTVDFTEQYIAMLHEMSHADVMKAMKNPALKPSEFRTLFEHLLPHQRRAMLEEQTLNEFSAAGGLMTGGYDAGSPTVQLVAEAETVYLYFNTAEDEYVYATFSTSTGFAFVEYWDGTSEVIGYGDPASDLYFEKYIETGDPYPAPRLVQITSCDANGGI